MAFTHIYFGTGTTHGSMLRSALSQLEVGKRELVNILATMATMLDGDGTNISHFNEVTSRFAFSNNTDAKAAWDELNSLKFKLTTDGSVTSVDAAMTQAFNKFR